MARFRAYVPSVRQAVRPGIATDLIKARQRNLSIPQWRAAQSARVHLLPDLSILEGGLVVDLGANVGDWTAAVLEVVPSARILAVEPATDPRATLVERFARDPRVTVDDRAVAATAGTREFHITEHSHNASLNQPRDMDTLYGDGWKVARRVTVETVTVDGLVQGRDLALLKIDVQGAEREVLAGATATLKRTAAVLLEVTFISHYEGDATFPWLHEHMTELGFRLAGLSEPKMSAGHAVLWCDACYVPG